MNICRFLISLLLTAFVLVGCGKSAAPGGKADNVFRIGNRSEVQDLDPHLCAGVAEFRALGALFEGLCTLDPKTMQPQPGAAASWTLSADGLVYTFQLQPNGHWSDGTPLTAEDFVYAWERMLTPALGAEYAYLLHCLKNGKAYNEGKISDFAQVGVKALAPTTLEVTLEQPVPYFLSMQIHFAWFPVPRHVIEKFGPMEKRGTPWTRPGNHVSNGPFMLKDWRPDEILQTVRNPHYWDAAHVKPDGIDFYPISNEQQEERRFRTGELDVTYTVPMHMIAEYKQAHPEELVLAPYLQTYYYRFNCTKPPFNDPRVRQAFSMALDREEIARNVVKAGEQPAYAFTPPNTAGYTSAYQVSADLAKAKQLLAEAGFPEGKGLPPLDLLYNTSETDKLLSEAVQRQWKERLGADVRLLNQEYRVYLDSMSRLNYDICRSTWLGDVLDPINFLECFLSGQGNNRTGYTLPEYDALIAQIYAEPDPAKRTPLMQQAEARLLQDAPFAPMLYMTQKFLKRPNITGADTNLLGYFRWQDFQRGAAK